MGFRKLHNNGKNIAEYLNLIFVAYAYFPH